jgi:hypothetical protein
VKLKKPLFRAEMLALARLEGRAFHFAISDNRQFPRPRTDRALNRLPIAILIFTTHRLLT